MIDWDLWSLVIIIDYYGAFTFSLYICMCVCGHLVTGNVIFGQLYGVEKGSLTIDLE